MLGAGSEEEEGRYGQGEGTHAHGQFSRFYFTRPNGAKRSTPFRGRTYILGVSEPSLPIPPQPRQRQLSVSARAVALLGLFVNLGLVLVKLVTGVVGHSYALIADAIESMVDVAGSAVIWVGLKVSEKPPDEDHPYGHGKAESIAALTVAVLLFFAGIGIAIEAVREIITPHHAPAWYTLLVLVVVVAVKEILFRVARAHAKADGSTAMAADAMHHRTDALTSVFAFVGISVALIGGAGWEPADDFAALAAACVVMFNAGRLGGEPLRELLDTENPVVLSQAVEVASKVPGVVSVDKPRSRKSGTSYWLDMHIRVDDDMNVREAHTLSHAVKDAVRAQLPFVRDVLIHIEPSRVANPHDGAARNS